MPPFPSQLNPQHNVPTFVDGDFVLNESRAIMVYIAQKWGKNSALFPEDIQVQARINQRLYFDATVFWKSFGDIFVSTTTITPQGSKA